MIRHLKTFQIYLFFLAGAMFFSCRQSSRPDVSKIKLNITIERFDKELYAAKSRPAALTTDFLAKKYGYFFDDYINSVVGNGQIEATALLDTLFHDQAYSDLQKETDSVFKTLSSYEKELTTSFKTIKYYYPKATVPRLISYVSGFAYQNIVGQDYLGIGLDMFLGKDSKFYGAIVQSAPRYQSRRFAPEYLVPRTVETYTREELFPDQGGQNLLSKMLYNGKIMYFMDQVLREDLADSIKIGYTSQQIDWCRNYEKEIWGFFLENKLLYEADINKVQVYLSDGPFTPGVGANRESAPKLGIWTGWQIIRSYMKNNPNVRLQELMASNDEQDILNKARYKP